MTNNNTDLNKVLKNEKLTKEQKVQIIQNYYDNYRANIDKELNDYIFKQRLGAALEIGSAAIPAGGLAGQAAKRIIPAVISKNVGRRFTQDIVKSSFSGAINGTVFGTGRGIMEDKNPVQTALQDATANATIGGVLGATSGKILNDIRTSETQGINQMRPYWGIPFRKASGNPEKAVQVLTENQTGFVPNVYNKPGIGNFDIPWGNKNSGLSHAIDRRVNQKNFDINEFVNDIPETIYNGIVTPGGTKHPENLNIETINQKIAIAPNIKNAGIDRNWLLTVFPQNKSARKRMGDLTPSPYISSENGSIPPSISELLTNNNITEYFQKNNPSDRLNSELSTAINAIIRPTTSTELPKFENKQKVESNPSTENSPILYGSVEMNVDNIPEITTGQAADMNVNQLAEILGLQSFSMEIPQVEQSPQSVLSGYTNPLTGNNRIFTREDIGEMSKEDYAKHEIEIQAQMNSIGVPTNGDLKRESLTGGGVVYVNSYKRSDGTEVKGYYRSKPRI